MLTVLLQATLITLGMVCLADTVFAALDQELFASQSPIILARHAISLLGAVVFLAFLLYIVAAWISWANE